MNICFDAGAIEMAAGSGIGNYTINQFKELIKLFPEDNFYYFNTIKDNSLKNIVKADNFKEEYFFCGKNNELCKYKSEYKNIFGNMLKNFIEENEIDVFYITAPFLANGIIYEKEWFGKAKVVATAWDVIPYVMKDRYLCDKNVYKWYMECIDMLKWTDRQLAISKSVKNDMVNYLGFSADKIDVIYGGVNDKFKIISIDEINRKKLFNKFSIINKFILCCVSADWRKNIQGAIEAYALLSEKIKKEYQLVIMGRVLQEKKEEYESIVKRKGLDNRIIFTNYVNDLELLQLYNLAELMIFPSLYEGFGLPAVEAWACGTPVISSKNSSLGEIVGDAGLLFDPTDIKDISRQIENALLKTDLNILLNKGRKKIDFFTWDNVARLTNSSIKKLYKKDNNEMVMVKEKIKLFFSEEKNNDIEQLLIEILSTKYDCDINDIVQSCYNKDVCCLVVVYSLDEYLKIKNIIKHDNVLCLLITRQMENILRKIMYDSILAENDISIYEQKNLSKIIYEKKINDLMGEFDNIILSDDCLIEKILSINLNKNVYDISINKFNIERESIKKYFTKKLFNVLDRFIEDKNKFLDREKFMSDILNNIINNDYNANDLHKLSKTISYAMFPVSNIDVKDVVSDNRNKIGVDFVTSWNTKCGIAEYTKYYYHTVSDNIDVSIFANNDDDVVYEDECFVKRCWSRQGNMDNLIDNIKLSTNDVIHIQYTEGFFRINELIKIIINLYQEKKIIITCHNTVYLKVKKGKDIKILNYASYIVHHQNDYDYLCKIGIDKCKINIIPLGQVDFPSKDKNSVRAMLNIPNNMYDLVIGSYGFLLPHKGVLETIHAVKKLLDTNIDVLYVVCCAMHPASISNEYLVKCRNEVDRLCLHKNVLFINEFLEPRESAYILQSCDINIMAYGESNESASGAARFCIATGRPLITTKSKIFSEFKDFTLQIDNNKSDNIFNGILELMNKSTYVYYQGKSNEWIKSRNWSVVANKIMECYSE